MMCVTKRPFIDGSEPTCCNAPTMLLLLLILAAALRSEASTSVTPPVLYHRPGQEASLPCGPVSPSDPPTCSDIKWLYSRTPEQSREVPTGPGQGSRTSLDSTCSLTIRNVSAEDAGLYACRRGAEEDRVHLSVLSISPPEPRTDGTVALACALSRHGDLGPCDRGSIRWLDGTEVLLGQGDVQQTNCVHVLFTKWTERRYTCQYVEAGTVRIEADYTPDAGLVYLGAGVGVGLVVLVVLLVVTALLLKKRTKATEDVQQAADAAETRGGVTYASISLQQVPAQSQVRAEETVTYSAIRAANTDASAVIKPRV